LAFTVGTLYQNRDYFRRGLVPRMLFPLTFAVVVAVLMFLSSDFSVALRLKAIMKGNDGSLYGRFTVPMLVLSPLLRDTKLLGLGFGNMNSDQGVSLLYEYGLSQGTSAAIIAFPNSYLHVLGEAGVFGAIILAIQLIYLVGRVKRTRCAFRVALLVFIAAYQVMGGYYTNLLNWVVYGIVASDSRFKELHTRSGTCDAYRGRMEV
ncbi:MAG: O-antigen ligase family protein, partial [Clostridium sp.]|nr:O-antigen ligase family protein [Clostridium sp.]